MRVGGFYYLPAATVDNLGSEVKDMPAYGGPKAYNLNCPLYRTVGVYYACVVKRQDSCVSVVQEIPLLRGVY